MALLYLGKKLQIRRHIQSTHHDCVYYTKQGSICIVNAASERDMTVFSLGMIKAKLSSLLHAFFVPFCLFVTNANVLGLFCLINRQN